MNVENLVMKCQAVIGINYFWYNSLIYVYEQMFKHVKITKSGRAKNVSTSPLLK